jgi:hypothetical protein
MATQQKTKPVRHVALAYPVAVPWMALFMRGVTDYAEQRGGWLLTASPPALSWAGEEPLALDSLRGWPGDGVQGIWVHGPNAAAVPGCGNSQDAGPPPGR